MNVLAVRKRKLLGSGPGGLKKVTVSGAVGLLRGCCDRCYDAISTQSSPQTQIADFISDSDKGHD
jgi:hypothetical protein